MSEAVALREDENLWCEIHGFASLAHWSSIMRRSCPNCGLDRHVVKRGNLLVRNELDCSCGSPGGVYEMCDDGHLRLMCWGCHDSLMAARFQ